MTTTPSATNERPGDLYRQLSSAIDRVPFKRTHIIIIFMIGVGALFDAIEQYNVGYAAPFLVKHWGLSTTEVALLTTFTFAGLAVGSVIAGVTGDLYGRRVTYMYNLLLFSVGGFISALAPDYTFLLIARLLVGIGLGGEIATALTIMSEMMPTRIRGAALGLINVAGGGFGIFVASALATLILGPMSGFLGGDGVAWRYLLGVLVVPALFVYYFRRYIPESPRFLVRVGKLDEVNRVLSQLASGKLRPVKNLTVTPYVRGVEGRVFAREKTRIAEMFHGVLLRRTATLWVMEVMTFGAQVAVTSLMPIILVAKGFSVESSLRYALLINIGSLLGAIAAATSGHFLPRRVTLCGGAILAAAASVGFGFAASTVSVIVFGLLTAFLFMLLNTTVWIYNPELYPTRLRGIGTGAGTTIGLGSAALFPLAAAALRRFRHHRDVPRRRRHVRGHGGGQPVRAGNPRAVTGTHFRTGQRNAGSERTWLIGTSSDTDAKRRPSPGPEARNWLSPWSSTTRKGRRSPCAMVTRCRRSARNGGPLPCPPVPATWPWSPCSNTAPGSGCGASWRCWPSTRPPPRSSPPPKPSSGHRRSPGPRSRRATKSAATACAGKKCST